ncbi:hypothetical protein [Streptomyces decoyicus]|uniref:hypothetical protein n=1 Tax=Streptomyces decoyicus TaxID=249567 RepID=UPI003866DF1C|nr:hypothetical protein OG532_18105 [Streptomyces decoyicus]
MQEWTQVVGDVAQDPLVQWAFKESVRAIVRRVQRGREAAAAHSEAGPALAPIPHRAEKPVTVTSDEMTGTELAESLLQGAGNERMRAATRLLGAYREGFWLRRLIEDQELADAAGRPLINRSGQHPSVDWSALGRLFLRTGWSRRASVSEAVMLESAVSLVGGSVVELRQVIHALDHGELQLVMRALEAAAYGKEG